MSNLFAASGVDAPTVIDLPSQIREARRELDLRNRVYPRFVDSGKMTAAEASRHLELQEAIIATLESLYASNGTVVSTDIGRQAAAVERAAANWRGHVSNLALLAMRGKRPQSEHNMAATWLPDLEAAALTMRALAGGKAKEVAPA